MNNSPPNPQSRYSRFVPILVEPPQYDLAYLKQPVGKRTYGTPAEHLKAEERQHFRALVRFAFGLALTICAVLVAEALYIAELNRNSEHTTPELVTITMGLLIANFIAFMMFGVPRKWQARRAKYGQTKAGLKGELRVAELLESLPDDYYVIHGVDITYPNSPPEDIDHVVVGPNGITAIDAKNWGGELVINREGVFHHGQEDTRLIEGTRRRAQHLAEFLGYESSIRQVVCFTGAAHANTTAHGITFTNRNNLLRVVRGGPRTLHPDMVKELAEDTGLLAPTAVVYTPWRHTYLGIQREERIAYSLRHLKLLTVPLFLLSMLGLFLSGAYTITNIVTQQAFQTILLVGGGVLVSGAVAGLLWKINKKLTVLPRKQLASFESPRSKGRMTRINETQPVLAASAPDDRPSPNLDDVQSSTKRLGEQELVELFTRELILPEKTLRDLVSLQMILLHPQEFKDEWADELPYGIILHGPPGTGKTEIARTMAKAGNLSFHIATPSELRQMYAGESSKMIKELYDRARATAPSIVF